MFFVLGLAATGCSFHTPSVVGQATVGWAHPWTQRTSSDGTSVEVALGAGDPGRNTGIGGGFSFRRTGETQELAISLHHFVLVPIGKQAAMFGRLSVNLLEWDRVGTDDGAGIGGPSFEIGIGTNGPCLVASARRDFRWNDRDDTFVGLSVGFCALIPATYVRGIMP